MISDRKMIVFDMDGVLVDVHSSWAWVHDRFEVDNEDSLKAYKRGEIDDLEFIRRDIDLWRSVDHRISKKDIIDILEEAPLMNGFDECFPGLEQKYDTAIISGGLKPLAKHIGEPYFNRIMANDIEEKNGRLTGQGVLEVRLKDKGEAFEKLLSEMDVGEEECVAVGNSWVDLPMIKRAGLGIAFNPADEKIREGADLVIEEKDLSLLLDHV